MDPPLISVIICHHVGRTLLKRCLESVAASRGVRVHPIVVTSDATYVNPYVHLYYLEDGPAAKRNLGVRHAKSETVVFLDDDVEISPYCLYAFWKFLQETPACGMAFAKIYNMERRTEFDDCGSWITSTGFLWARAGHGQVDHGQYNQPQKILASKSATCAIRRRSFYRAGGFDAGYYILGEETDLAWRVWLQGEEVWYCPTAISWHAFGCSSLKPKEEFYTNERIFYRGCLNYLRCLTTNAGSTRFWQMFPPHLVGWLVAAFGFGLCGQGQRTLYILRALQDYVRYLPKTLRKRYHVQRYRTMTDRTLWPYISTHPPLRYYGNRLLRYWTTQLHG